MLVYIIRRLMQAALVMVVMSALVFAGIFLIGDPVAMMISPDASEVERHAREERRWGSVRPPSFRPPTLRLPR